jgi:hypothetical protein
VASAASHPERWLAAADAQPDAAPHAVHVYSRALTPNVGGRPRREVQEHQEKHSSVSAMTNIRLSCQSIEEQKMNTDPKKWNPFKFLQSAGRKPDADIPQSPAASEPWR